MVVGKEISNAVSFRFQPELLGPRPTTKDTLGVLFIHNFSAFLSWTGSLVKDVMCANVQPSLSVLVQAHLLKQK